MKKKRILVEHFRHSRSFQPMVLQHALLLHQINYLLPQYPIFKEQMDTATKGLANYLSEILDRVFEPTQEAIKNILEDLVEFQKANTTKYVGEMGGWHTVIHRQEKDKVDKIMFTLLLDHVNYGLHATEIF